MNPFYTVCSILSRFFPPRAVYAHCDIPCGIYTVEPARTAAKTVLKMVEKILALPTDGSPQEILQARNSFVRMVQVKEEHAQMCKKEILILWTDYFKPEHLIMFPELHDTFWKAAKLCSKVKQEIHIEAAKALQDAVEEIAQMFSKAEEAKHH